MILPFFYFSSLKADENTIFFFEKGNYYCKKFDAHLHQSDGKFG